MAPESCTSPNHFTGQILQGRWIESEKPEEPVRNSGMEDCESSQSIDPKPMMIHFPMLPRVNESRVRRIADCGGNGVGGEHAALQGIKNALSSQGLDHASGVADVQQVEVLPLNGASGQWGDRLPTMIGCQSEFPGCFLTKLFGMFRPANQTEVGQTFADGG
jgi:hypothetical protein